MLEIATLYFSASAFIVEEIIIFVELAYLLCNAVS